MKMRMKWVNACSGKGCFDGGSYEIRDICNESSLSVAACWLADNEAVWLEIF